MLCILITKKKTKGDYDKKMTNQSNKHPLMRKNVAKQQPSVRGVGKQPKMPKRTLKKSKAKHKKMGKKMTEQQAMDKLFNRVGKSMVAGFGQLASVMERNTPRAEDNPFLKHNDMNYGEVLNGMDSPNIEGEASPNMDSNANVEPAGQSIPGAAVNIGANNREDPDFDSLDADPSRVVPLPSSTNVQAAGLRPPKNNPPKQIDLNIAGAATPSQKDNPGPDAGSDLASMGQNVASDLTSSAESGIADAMGSDEAGEAQDLSSDNSALESGLSSFIDAANNFNPQIGQTGNSKNGEKNDLPLIDIASVDPTLATNMKQQGLDGPEMGA